MKKLSKTTKNNLITYGMVILAYIIVQILPDTYPVWCRDFWFPFVHM